MSQSRAWLLLLSLVLPLHAQLVAPAAGIAQSVPVHGPARALKLQPNGTYASTNWAGYALTGSGFTFVSGSWTVPTVDCGGTLNSDSASWVGLDGFAEDSDTG